MFDLNTPSKISVACIKQGVVSAFENAFTEYYPMLVNFACGILKDRPLAEEQVQEVFTILWERREGLKEELPLLPFLLTSVRNKCINIINHRLVETKYLSEAQRAYRGEILDYAYDDLTQERLDRLHRAINTLPPRCKEVFILSRFEDHSHLEIKKKLGISTKSIENHITKALRVIKENIALDVSLLANSNRSR